jgi:hypothetical protein
MAQIKEVVILPLAQAGIYALQSVHLGAGDSRL